MYYWSYHELEFVHLQMSYCVNYPGEMVFHFMDETWFRELRQFILQVEAFYPECSVISTKFIDLNDFETQFDIVLACSKSDTGNAILKHFEKVKEYDFMEDYADHSDDMSGFLSYRDHIFYCDYCERGQVEI